MRRIRWSYFKNLTCFLRKLPFRSAWVSDTGHGPGSLTPAGRDLEGRNGAGGGTKLVIRRSLKKCRSGMAAHIIHDKLANPFDSDSARTAELFANVCPLASGVPSQFSWIFRMISNGSVERDWQ